MNPRLLLIVSMAVTLNLVSTGCRDDENRRMAEISQRHEQRQADQNNKAAELQREVVTLQHAVQNERAEIGRQRDQLERCPNGAVHTRHLHRHVLTPS